MYDANSTVRNWNSYSNIRQNTLNKNATRDKEDFIIIKSQYTGKYSN